MGRERVPTIVRYPGVTPAGAVCEAPISSIDFYPTILEAAEVEGEPEHNRRLDGLSLLPILPGGLPEGPYSAVRHGDWKLLHFYESDRSELYNLAEDRTELNDLAAERPGMAGVMRRFWHVVAERITRLPKGQRRETGEGEPKIRPGWITDRD